MTAFFTNNLFFFLQRYNDLLQQNASLQLGSIRQSTKKKPAAQPEYKKFSTGTKLRQTTLTQQLNSGQEDEEEDDLPPGWVGVEDAQGTKYFVHHQSQKIVMNKPDFDKKPVAEVRPQKNVKMAKHFQPDDVPSLKFSFCPAPLGGKDQAVITPTKPPLVIDLVDSEEENSKKSEVDTQDLPSTDDFCPPRQIELSQSQSFDILGKESSDSLAILYNEDIEKERNDDDTSVVYNTSDGSATILSD